MARRRVNLKFLVIVLLSIVGVAGVLLLGHRFLFKENPKRYIDAAHRFESEKRYVDARFNYEKALALDSRDAALTVAYANCLHKLAGEDISVQGQDRKFLEQALAIDPTYRPALQRLMALEIESVEYDPRPAGFQRLHDWAQKMLNLLVVPNLKPLRPGAEFPEIVRNYTDAIKAIPTSKIEDPKGAAEAASQALAYAHISTLAGWVMGIIQPDEVIEEEINWLVELQKFDPANPDVPYYLANAYIKQARELKVQGHDKDQEANVLFDKAVAVFDVALQTQPEDSAAMYIRFYTVLRAANQLVTENDDAPDKQKYVNRMREILSRARSFVTKEDPAFTEVYIQSADFMLRQNEPAEAEKLLRELMRLKEHDQTARLAMAELLHADPVKRHEMIELLKQEVTDEGMNGVMSQVSKRELELRTYLEVCKLLIEEWYAATGTERKSALEADIKVYYQRLADREPTHPETLKLKAKMLLMAGGVDAPINAIPIIEAAINSFGVRSANDGVARKDWELEFLLAKCYFDNKQTGDATKRLIQITEAVPRNASAHLLLAQLFIENHDFNQARDQLNILNKLTPNDPAVGKLNVALLSLTEDKKALSDAIGQMKSDTLSEKKQKLRVYWITKNYEPALPVALSILGEDPTDFETVDVAARVYWLRGETEKAQEVVTTAAKLDPSNKQLDVLLKQLKGEKTEVIAAAMAEVIKSIGDDFQRELKYFDFYFAQNQASEAMPHLDAAEKLRPEDPKVLDVRFQLAANERRWAEADKYVARLAAINADQAHGTIYRYRLALSKGDIPAAAEQAQDLVKSLPQYARSWLCLADIQRMQGGYLEAVNNYLQALEKQPQNIDAYRGIIDCYYQLNRPAEALRYIREGLRQSPGNNYLTEEKIKYDLTYGEPQDAIVPRLKYRDENPELSEGWLMLGSAYFLAAQRLNDSNKAVPSREFARLAKETLEQGSAKWPDEKMFYAYLADLAIFSHETASGEKALKDLASRPAFVKSVEPRLLLADYYVRSGQLNLAEASLKEAVDMATDTAEVKQKSDVRQKLATFYQNQGKFDLALAQLDPNSAELRVQLQRIDTLVAASKPAEAQAILQKVLAAHPNDAQLIAMSGFLLMIDGKQAAALKSLNEALAIDPKSQMALYHRGRLYLAMGGDSNLDRSINDLSTARDLAPRNALVRLALAEALLLKGENDACVNEMRDAVKNQPSSKEMRLKLLELLARQQPPRWDDAERLLRETREMPEFIKDPDWLQAEGNMWIARNKPDKAIKSMEAALTLAGQVNVPPERMGLIQQDYLRILLQGKKYKELLDNTNALLADSRVAEKVWWVYQLRAIAYRYLDQKDKSLEDFDKAIQIANGQKNDEVVMTLIDSIADTVGVKEAIDRLKGKVDAGESHWRVILAYLYLKGEDYLNAVNVIDRVMAESSKLKDRDLEAAQDIAGRIYILSREYDKAVNVYEKILARTPDNTGAMNNIACVLGELKENPDPKQALRYTTKAISLLEQKGLPVGTMSDTHGWMLTLDKQYDEGIRYLRMSLDHEAVPEAEYHLAFALMQKNQASDAVTELEKAKRLLDDRKKKSIKVDAKLEAKIDEALIKARQMAAVSP